MRNGDVEKWKELVKQDRTRGEEFYRHYLLPKSIKMFSEKYGRIGESNIREKYNYLISLVGFSPEPIILMLHALNPQKTLFLYTQEAEQSLNIIWQFYSFKTPMEHDIQKIDSSQVENVYEKIKEFIADKNPKEVAVDITGGKKAMVSGASAAAALAGCAILYVDYSEYDPELRKPIPGTEYINELKNPIEIFGEIDAAKGRELFNKGNFSASIEVFDRLEKSVMHPERYQIFKELAILFGQWEEYNFNKAFNHVENLEKFIDRYRMFTDWIPKLKKYKEIFSNLINEDVRYLVLNHYFLARRYKSRAKFDFAALLLYRTLEMAIAYHLQKAYNLQAREPDYSFYPGLQTTYQSLIQWVHGKKARRVNLPFRIGLMDGLIMLSALDDAMIRDKQTLKRIKDLADVRNNSILAHGTRRVERKTLDTMEKVFRPLIDDFVRRYLGNKSITDFEANFEVVKL